MTPHQLRSLLEGVARGDTDPETAAAELIGAVFGPGEGFDDFGYAQVDTHRPLRTGEVETVYGAGKTPGQIVEIVTRLREAHPRHPVLVT